MLMMLLVEGDRLGEWESEGRALRTGRALPMRIYAAKASSSVRRLKTVSNFSLRLHGYGPDGAASPQLIKEYMWAQ